MLDRDVEITIDLGRSLGGALAVPDGARALVLFVHGSGSSRFSWRNLAVARVLLAAGFATLLLDLLTEEEARHDDATAALRFDISLLAQRVAATIDWVRGVPALAHLPIGLFGASTGAAAALIVAAARAADVAAVVSRGGRPDLARDALASVESPTLLIVGEADEEVLALNEVALASLHCPKQLALVPGATHLFEEPGALDQVARLARAWFLRHLRASSPAPTRVTGPDGA